MMKNFLAFFYVTFFVFAGTASAELLFPTEVGYWWELEERDSGETTLRLEVLRKEILANQEYSVVGAWDFNSEDLYSEFPIRSTDNAVYVTDGIDEIELWQAAPVGTTWSLPGEGGQEITEISSIESVTVPFGTFDNAYVHRNYFDPDASAEPNSPFWYEYVVPGVGLVKTVDDWVFPPENAPVIEELARRGFISDAGTVFLPSVDDNGVFQFNLDVTGLEPILIDPDVAVGYDYAVGAGDPNFYSVELPLVGNDDEFVLSFMHGLNLINAVLMAGQEYIFPSGGVDSFRVLGIDPLEGLDPNDVAAFMTTVKFVADGQFTGTMTPITVFVDSVPEPATVLLMGLGLAGLGFARRRRNA